MLPQEPLITKTLLTDLGVALPDAEIASLSDHFEKELDQRVVTEITAELETDQLEQLAAMRDAPEAEMIAWLKTTVPELKEIIEDEAAILLGELAEQSDKL